MKVSFPKAKVTKHPELSRARHTQMIYKRAIDFSAPLPVDASHRPAQAGVGGRSWPTASTLKQFITN